MLGNIPNYALDATMLTTNTRMASLLYQMQITGYMFKNAEYQMSMTKMLKGLPRTIEKAVAKQGGNDSIKHINIVGSELRCIYVP